MREDHPSAGFWIRLFARTTHLILILATFNLFYLGDRMGADAGLWAPSGFGEGFWFDRLSAENVGGSAFFVFFPVFYYVYLHGAYGQTFGKMALRIKVLNEDGSPLDYRKAYLRWLGYFPCDLTLALCCLWAALEPRKQGLHDKVCRTIVVHENARTGACQGRAGVITIG